MTRQRPIRETIRERQLKFIGHCLRMKQDELVNINALYKAEIGNNRRGAPLMTYLQQKPKHVCGDKNLSANEIRELAKEKTKWKQVVAPKKPVR